MTTTIQEHLQKRLPDAIEFLRQMVGINSFSANAAGVNRLGEIIAAKFAPLGFSAEFVQSTNPSFGRHLFLHGPAPDAGRPDTRPLILIVSHLDTVFPPEEEQANDFSWRVEGERAYGPGTVDIKGGTALVWLILDTLHDARPQVFHGARWLIGLDASEETLSDDFGRLCLERIGTADKGQPLAGSGRSPQAYCLVFEGGTPNASGIPLVTARKGRAEFQISVAGRGAHAGNYHKVGANAVVQMAITLQKVAALTDYERQLTVNPGVVHGGSVVNRVPHAAEALVELRAFDPQVFAAAVEAMLALEGSSDLASADGYPCRVGVKLRSRSRPWPRNPGTDSLYAVWSEAAGELGLTVVPEQRGGLSDGNLLWSALPTIDGLGPAGNNAHSSERSADGSKVPEYVLLDSFVPKARLNIAAITRLVQSSAAPESGAGA